MDTYADALYQVKRGFLIIGLTGFTGAGCSTVSRLLTRQKKPELPRSYPSKTAETNESQFKRRQDKLKVFWNELEWEPFVPLDVSVVIFAFAVKRSLSRSFADSRIKTIKSIALPQRADLEGLKFLTTKEKLTDTQATKLIKSYKICRQLYRSFKGNYGLSDFIPLIRNFGDEIRRFSQVNPSKKALPSPASMIVLPEAIRKIIRAYRQTENATRFCIDAFRNPYEVEFLKRRYS